jgi:hypothetical protein
MLVVGVDVMAKRPVTTADILDGRTPPRRPRRAGAPFVNGKLLERPDDQDQQGGAQQAT